MGSTTSSAAWFERAQRVLPGGVNSPVRAFRGVGGQPRFFTRGTGPYLTDVEGREYLDFVMSWGPLILGHAHPKVLERVAAVLNNGFSFGAPSPLEVELGEAIVAAVPGVEMVRLVCSGTEASMSALRLARGATGRNRCVKFAGCYHGHVDSLLATAGSGVATFGLPDSPGVPAELAALTLSLPYGDLAAVQAAFAQHGDDIACVIVEPVAGNMGVVEPPIEFLRGLRQACDQAGALLIFDEVMTGFRVAYGGVQARVGVTPDLTVLGKVIGGGFPLAAYGGRADLLRQVAPAGPVYQAGTLSGNPVAVAAGLATLEELRQNECYEWLEQVSSRLYHGLAEAAEQSGVPVTINRVGAMLTMFFQDGVVTDYDSAKQSDTARYACFFHAMLERGVYLPPSQYEAWFPSVVHSEAVIDRTVEVAREAFRWCAESGWQAPA